MKSVLKISLLLLTVLHTVNYVKTQDEVTDVTEEVKTTEESVGSTTMKSEEPPEEVPTETELPVEYKVTEKDGDKTVSYVNTEQTSAPIIKEENITSMELDDNNIVELSSATFPQVLSNLKTLSVTNNMIVTINKTAFEKLPNLETLDLSDNHIVKLTDDLSASEKLSALILDNNAPNLEKYKIPKIPSLKKLVLSNCKLTKLSENVFENVPNLEELDLNSNDITDDDITIEAFKGLTQLSKLILPKSAATNKFANAVCKANKNLKNICIETCEDETISCVIKDDETIMTVDDDMSVIAPVKAADEFQNIAYSLDNINQDSPIMRKNDMKVEEPEDTVPATSRTGVTTNGVSGSAIGAVVGILIVIVAGIIVKKNWSAIKSKFTSEGTDVPAPNPRANGAQMKTPEEVPLQTKNDQNPV